jgi:hypothetical protein
MAQEASMPEVESSYQRFFRRVRHPLRTIHAYFKSKAGVPLGLYLANFFVQRVLGINGAARFQLHYTSTIIAPNKVKLGTGAWRSFARSGNCYIQAGNGIEIGANTIFAPSVKLISANHDPNNDFQWYDESGISIGEYCWIGANAIILPGVKIGNRCVVGAGAVVTKSFGDGVTLVGVPARALKKR